MRHFSMNGATWISKW